jgi:hypothetical protein
MTYAVCLGGVPAWLDGAVILGNFTKDTPHGSVDAC